MGWSPKRIARAAVAAAYLATELVLIATAGSRADAAFGFRMFNESSSVDARLFREVDAPSGHGTVLIAANGGKWSAKDDTGNLHRFDWYERVKSGAIAPLDVTTHASYGAAAQVARLNAALDDVAAHINGDAETRALVLVIRVSKNGRPPELVTCTAEVSR